MPGNDAALGVPKGGIGGKLPPNRGFTISGRLGGCRSGGGICEFKSAIDVFFDSKNEALWRRKLAAKRRQLAIIQVDASTGGFETGGGHV